MSHNKPSNYWKLINVTLETGFEYDENNNVVATRTNPYTLTIEKGKITAMEPYSPSDEGRDAGELLLLPSFKDMHTHLDKHFFGLPWQAKKPGNKDVQDMIAYEQKIIPSLLKSSTERAEQLITRMQSYGTDFARTHINIDSTSKLESLHHLEQALANKKDTFSTEIVAFPQHGLYHTPSAAYMREAAALDCIDYIGGLDPTCIDGNLEKSIDFTIQLALDYHKGIDIHLHEMGASGRDTLNYLCKKVEAHPELKGKTFVSHCYVLGSLEEKEVIEIAQILASAGVGIITTFPFADFKMPYRILLKYGVDVRTGTDNIYDHWSTFGWANLLQKAHLAAELYHLESEFDLSRTLQLATHQLTPLNDNGEQVWPKIGDLADFVIIDASCSAEAVARLRPVRLLVHQGKIVEPERV